MRLRASRKVRKRISPPIFKGDKGERPEAHLLRAKDWFDSSGIVRNQDKVYNFKHTLDSKAREWYADLINKATIPPRWPDLETAFSRYFSTQGRSIKHLHDSWRKMSFNPETDDIEEFVRDAQECAKQLEYDDHVIINMIKSVMPREIYGTLYYMDDLAEVINFCKDYFSKNPRDQKDEASTAPDKGASALTPFSKITSSAQPLDFQQSLTQLTENLYKLDFNQKPYKPTIYPQGRGRGRGRGNGRFQGRGGGQRSYQPYNPQRRGRGRGGFRGRPRGGQRFDKSPTKRNPRENSKTKDADRDRCRYCREIGHWVKDCPQKKRDDEKASEGATGTFSNLSEIAQDFYGTPDVFHGITDIYKENQEEQEGPQETETGGPHTTFKLLKGDDCSTKSLPSAGKKTTRIPHHNRECLTEAEAQTIYECLEEDQTVSPIHFSNEIIKNRSLRKLAFSKMDEMLEETGPQNPYEYMLMNPQESPPVPPRKTDDCYIMTNLRNKPSNTRLYGRLVHPQYRDPLCSPNSRKQQQFNGHELPGQNIR